MLCLVLTLLLGAPAFAGLEAFCQPSLLDVPVGVGLAFNRARDGTLADIEFEDLTDFVKASAYYEGRELSFIIRLKLGDPKRPRALYGRDVFRLALGLAEVPIERIVGHWVYGDNLRRFNELTKGGMSSEEAASLTWTGRTAARFGFSEVSMRNQTGPPGYHRLVSAVFTRPQGSRLSNSSGNGSGAVASPSNR